LNPVAREWLIIAKIAGPGIITQVSKARKNPIADSTVITHSKDMILIMITPIIVAIQGRYWYPFMKIFLKLFVNLV
jgi:hypothetical protein